MKTKRAKWGAEIVFLVVGVWTAMAYVIQNGGATQPSNAAPALTRGGDRFRFHEKLADGQKASWDFMNRLSLTGVPTETRALFVQWALLLYQDSLRVNVERLPANDPVAQEFGAALLADYEPRIEMVLKANPGTVPETRLTKLLAQVAALPSTPGAPEAQWMCSEFQFFFKKAKQRSDGFFMSEMKDQFDSSAPLEAKIEYVKQFVDIRDVTMSEYPREFFENLLRGSALGSGQRVKVKTLLEEINQLSTP